MPLHSVCGAQLSRQVPATHAWVDRHALPQLPQFSLSLEVSAEHVPEPPLPSPESPGSLLEQATKHDKPKRIEPPKSHRGRERVLLSDRMTEPFLCSIKQRRRVSWCRRSRTGVSELRQVGFRRNQARSGDVVVVGRVEDRTGRSGVLRRDALGGSPRIGGADVRSEDGVSHDRLTDRPSVIRRHLLEPRMPQVDVGDARVGGQLTVDDQDPVGIVRPA